MSFFFSICHNMMMLSYDLVMSPGMGMCLSGNIGQGGVQRRWCALKLIHYFIHVDRLIGLKKKVCETS